MPQMAPVSWTLLFIYFTMLMLIMMIMNYYLSKKTIFKKIKKSSINMNWKW